MENFLPDQPNISAAGNNIKAKTNLLVYVANG
jgi:hypothetical protein